MGNLLASLRSSADAMGVFQKQLQVAQNNVSNASTPGYARQVIYTVARPFDPDTGLAGGVEAGAMRSARSRFAEDNVLRQAQRQGRAAALAEIMGSVEAAFPVDGEGGPAAALNGLLRSFSSWSVAPNDANARQAVVDEARGLAASFRDTATALAGASAMADRQLEEIVGHINSLAGQLRDCNLEARLGSRGDAGLDARMNATLEELAELIDFTVVPQEDGSMMLLAGGAVPLVVGNRLHPLHLDFGSPADPPYPGGPAAARILDDSGVDVTARFTGGSLAGTLEARNEIIGGLIGNTQQPGELNRLAAAVAGRINAILAQGQTADGSSPAEDLFVFDNFDLTAAARSLEVNEAFRPDMLAAVDAGPPYVSNGTALKLASLAQSQDPLDKLDGSGFLQFYAGLAAQTGRRTADARQTAQLQAGMAAQARSLRSEIQGVSLDEEAIKVIEFQRAYQAAAQVLTVLNELTGITVNLLR